MFLCNQTSLLPPTKKMFMCWHYGPVHLPWWSLHFQRRLLLLEASVFLILFLRQAHIIIHQCGLKLVILLPQPRILVLRPWMTTLTIRMDVSIQDLSQKLSQRLKGNVDRWGSVLLVKKSVPTIFTICVVHRQGLTHRLFCVDWALFEKIKAGEFLKTQIPGFPFKPSSPVV